MSPPTVFREPLAPLHHTNGAKRLEEDAVGEWRNLGALKRVGLSTQVLKTALASGLSWQLAVWLLGSDKPYLAPLAAILSGQVTVADSISRGSQRIMGVVGGIALSLAAVHFLGLTAWSVAVLVLIGMAMATAVGFGPNAISQVAVSGLLVLSLGAAPQYAARRLLDTILGALVAVLVNALVVPPDATPAAERQTVQLSEDAANMLQDLSERLGRRPVAPRLSRARALSERVESLKESVKLARQSLLYSPLLQRRRRRLEQLERALALLQRVTIEVRGIARSLASLDGRTAGFESVLRPPLQQLADLVRSYGATVGRDAWSGRAQFAAAIDEALSGEAEALSLLARPPRQVSPSVLREVGSVLADVAKMVQDLEEAVATEPEPTSP